MTQLRVKAEVLGIYTLHCCFLQSNKQLLLLILE
jgi:hypothetical protein